MYIDRIIHYYPSEAEGPGNFVCLSQLLSLLYIVESLLCAFHFSSLVYSSRSNELNAKALCEHTKLSHFLDSAIED